MMASFGVLACVATAVSAAHGAPSGAPEAHGAAHATATRHSASRVTAARAHASQDALRFYSRRIERFRTQTWYWQRLMGVPRTPIRTRRLAAVSAPGLRHLAAEWRHRETAAHRRARHPPHLSNWLCIHRYEGSWTDAGAPYYGGLQMNLAFQQTYGGWLLRRKGTANHWTPLEQIWTAERAHRVRGYHPWPNTARACGLL